MISKYPLYLAANVYHHPPTLYLIASDSISQQVQIKINLNSKNNLDSSRKGGGGEGGGN